MEKYITMYGDMPEKMVKAIRVYSRPAYIIAFGFCLNDGVSGKYMWYEQQLEPTVWDYGSLVDAIISTYYPQDKMQAVINNYLLDPNNEDSLNEFNAMQEKRAWAKKTAKKLMAYAEENGIIEHFDEK